MKYMTVIVLIVAVAFAAISGTPITGGGASCATEAVPERQVLTPSSKEQEGAAQKGRPPDKAALQISEEIIIAKENVGIGDSENAAHLMPSDNFTNGHILAAG